MAYGLPAHGEANWDTKLSDSIVAVKATADAAQPSATRDVSVAGDIGNGASATTAALATFYAPIWRATTGTVNLGPSTLVAENGGANTAVGFEAGKLVTSGGSNVAIGYQALATGDVTSFCTAVGEGALKLNTASSNTAVGWRALASNVGGSGVVALGWAALAANTSGNYNTALGHQTLAANTTATGSTAVGYQSLKDSTGQLNTAIGHKALLANTTGESNTAVGDSAMFSNTTGLTNTAIGQLSLGSCVSGAQNSGLGHGTLFGITDGSVNTAVGMEAGHRLYDQTASDVTHGNYNTFLGGRATVATGTDASSQTAVGYGAAVGATYATAIGAGDLTHTGARALHAGSVAIGVDNAGTGAVTVAANDFILGTALHQVKVSNNATGAGSAALGANSPATTNTAPYTWLKMKSGDGSTVYVPAWK